MPLLIFALAYFMFPLLMSKSTIGSDVDFAECIIKTIDPSTGKPIISNEQVEIIPVNHDVKLIEAQTFDGAIYGLGFLHGKERLW